MNIDFSSLSGSQIKTLVGKMDTTELQSYIDKIQEIQNTQFDIENQPLYEYSDIIADLDNKQAALLLSTQGVTNAQIQQTLAIKGLSVEDQYLAMQEAGLLATKQQLNNVELQSILTSQLGSEAKAKEAMMSMGLSVAIEGEESQTVQLTDKKLAQAIANGALTASEAQLLAMTTGITIAQNTQSATSMPRWIAQMKAMTLATWGEVKATIAWLATNPVGWCVLAAGAIAAVTAAIILNEKAAERAQEKIDKLHDSYNQTTSDLESINSELETIAQKIEEIQSKGKLELVDQEELDKLRQQTRELELQQAILEKQQQADSTKLVSEIRNKSDKLNDNFDTDLLAYTDKLKYIEGKKIEGIKAINEGIATYEQYEEDIARDEDMLNLYYEDVLKNIANFEENKQAILNKYNGNYDQMSIADKNLYDSIISSLNKAYKAIYSDSEYNQLVIEPIFSEDSLNGLQEQLVEYFITGGSLDTVELENKFGSDIVQALRVACEKAGLELSDLLSALYNQAENTSFEFAPIKNVNSQFDVEQNQRSQEKIDYYYSLDDSTRDLIINAKIPDEVKNGTLEDFKAWIEELQKNAEIEVNIDVTAPLSDIKDAYSSFEDIYDEIINGSSVSADAIDKLNEKFGEINGGESLEKFKEVLTTMPDDIEAQHEALNQLATDYLDQSSLIQNLTVDNAEYTESELKKLGVENAHEVVQSRLIQHNYSEADAKNVLINYSNQLVDAKERERIASLDLENATVGEIATLINEANAAGIDTTALISYLNQKIRATQITLNTEGDINNLSKLCSALGGTVTYLEEYQRVKALLTEGGTIYGNGTADYQYLNGLKQRADEEVRNAFDNAMSANVVYNGSLTSSSGSGSGGGSSSPVKDTTKQYNWLEVAITRVQEAISRLNKIESNSFIGWIKRNVALNKEISKVTDNINLQRKAYEYYMSKANSIGLSEEYKQKVQNGAIQIEDITDEALQNQIDQYQEWYNKAIECSDAIQDLNIQLSELQKKKFDNIKTEYDSLISLITSKADILDERINRIEKQGYFVNKDYYEKLIAYENAEINNLKNEYSDLQSSLEEGLSNGLIEEGSEEWSNMKSEILDVEKAIEESTTSLTEYGNALRELNWEIFDYTEDRISSIVDETEFLIDLLSNSNLYDDTGRFNDKGESVNALRAVNYNTYMQQALDYANELKKIESDIAKDPANKDLIERREELLKLQQEAISNAESEKDAIKSLVQDGINIHLDALNSLIDKYKDALNSAKDLYDYQKNIGEQTQEISNFEKIISAYQGDNSEESRKLIQDYQNKLDEAKQNLKETEWDRYISETGDLLDTLYSDYEDVLNARLDDVNALIADMITEANNNSASVKNTIESETEKVGYQITDTMETIFSNNSTIVSSFMDKFTNSSTAIQTAINDIKNLVSQMIVNGNTDIMTNTDVTGAYTKDGWSQSVDGTWTYRENGNLLTNQWIQSNDKWYHLGEDGNMDTDKWIHND